MLFWLTRYFEYFNPVARENTLLLNIGTEFMEETCTSHLSLPSSTQLFLTAFKQDHVLST